MSELVGGNGSEKNLQRIEGRKDLEVRVRVGHGKREVGRGYFSPPDV